jgi:hyperosmotically inducible periplasmic protein
MKGILTATLMTLVLTGLARAQDGPIQRAGQALDRTGKNIRYRVETEIAKGQSAAEEREVLHRIARRVEWDKRFTGATIRIDSRAGGTIVLSGSVPSPQVRQDAVELVQNTVGVNTVVDKLAIVAEVKVIRTKPAGPAVEVAPRAPAAVEVAPSTSSAVEAVPSAKPGPETTVTVKP